MACKGFDDQLVNKPTKKLRKLLKDYVLCRVIDLTGIDIGHYDFDPDTTIYCFIINQDEDIYLRYGGRDDEAADTYLNMKSIEIALQHGLTQHALYKAGKLTKQKRAAPKFPRDYSDIKNNQIKKKQCVHCHMIGSAETRVAQKAGTLNKLVDLWIYPDIKRMGIQLDVPKGLTVKKASGAAKKAGLKSKDKITALDGTPVLSYGDLQHRLDKVKADSKSLTLTVSRAKADAPLKIKVELDKYWRVTKIQRRSETHALTPFPEFWGRPLTDKQKRKYGIKKDDFACEVTKFWGGNPRVHGGFKAGMRKGDIVYEVDGLRNDPYTDHPPTWLRLNRKTGDTVTVKVLRGRKKLTFTFKLRAKPW